MLYQKKRPPLEPCPVEVVIDLVGGKWKARILRVLADEPQTFSGMKKRLKRISQQVLSTQLKALSADGLIARQPGAQDAPPVYELTTGALSLLPALDAIAAWGVKRLKDQGLSWSADQGPLNKL